MYLRSSLLPRLVPVAAVLLMIGSAAKMSLTVDEAHYIGLGKYLVETGDWGLKGAWLHPPLSFYANSALLFPRSVPDSVWNVPAQDGRGRALCRTMRGNRMLLVTRLPGILLAAALFLLVFREARRAFGPAGGGAALLLAAFEPNLLAHGSLATPDLPLAATFLWAVFRFRRAVVEGGARNVLLAGVALALALLSKYTAVLLVAILPATALGAGHTRRLVPRTLAVLAIALAVLHAGYVPFYLHGARSGPSLRDGILPGPYREGIDYQSRANAGHLAFFRGEISREGWRAYYPVALLAKTPIPLLLLAAAGAVGLARRKRRATASWLLVPPLLFLLFFVVESHIDIGVRYVLPVYPFLALLGGSAASRVTGRCGAAVVGALLLWHVAGAAVAYPHFLSYFNEAVGGPEGGAAILSDSNIDWGQDLPGLGDFLERHGYEGCYLAYFGNGDPERWGIRFRYAPGWLYLPPRRLYDAGLLFHPDPELVAISRFVMQGVRFPNPKPYRWLERYPRVATIGHSILVYDIGGDPSAHDELARAYKMAGRLDYFRDELLVGMEEEKERRRRAGRGETGDE